MSSPNPESIFPASLEWLDHVRWGNKQYDTTVSNFDLYRKIRGTEGKSLSTIPSPAPFPGQCGLEPRADCLGMCPDTPSHHLPLISSLATFLSPITDGRAEPYVERTSDCWRSWFLGACGLGLGMGWGVTWQQGRKWRETPVPLRS